MALDFEREIELGAAVKPIWGQEPTNELWSYFIEATLEQLENTVAIPVKGEYANLQFDYRPPAITRRQVTDYGVKTLPHYGGFAFFTLLQRDTSYVIVPIHHHTTPGPLPTVVITISGGALTLTVTSPEYAYECYRIEVLQGYYNEEWIVYADNGSFTKTVYPSFTGECWLKVTGYAEEISISSLPFEEQIEL